MTRRKFFSLLAALPLVGCLLRQASPIIATDSTLWTNESVMTADGLRRIRDKLNTEPFRTIQPPYKFLVHPSQVDDWRRALKQTYIKDVEIVVEHPIIKHLAI